MVRSPAHGVPPPLMGDFVGCHFLNEPAELTIDVPEKHPSLRRVSVGGNREINQVRPGLSKGKIGLLSDKDFVVRNLAEVSCAQL